MADLWWTAFLIAISALCFYVLCYLYSHALELQSSMARESLWSFTFLGTEVMHAVVVPRVTCCLWSRQQIVSFESCPRKCQRLTLPHNRHQVCAPNTIRLSFLGLLYLRWRNVQKHISGVKKGTATTSALPFLKPWGVRLPLYFRLLQPQKKISSGKLAPSSRIAFTPN